MAIYGVFNKITNAYKKGEVRCTGEMMVLQKKNSNILFYGAYFWFDNKIILKVERSIKKAFLNEL